MATPKPRPTKLKVLDGNPSRRPLPVGEPIPDVSVKVPSPPKHLTMSAKREWKKLAVKLHRLGLLTDIDAAALALYCQAYGRWVDSEIELSIHGTIIKTTNGNLVNNPYLNIANTAMRDCHKYLSEFGMTPSARAKVTIAEKQPQSKFSGLIAGNM